MNIDNNIKASTPEFDKTYLKERFGLSHLEDTLQINNYVDILSLIYNKINTTKKTKFDNINYEYPAEIKSILDLFNSGKCEIKVVGDINFGVAGKNIIEYRATDPTGNTTIIKRVITIE